MIGVWIKVEAGCWEVDSTRFEDRLDVGGERSKSL